MATTSPQAPQPLPPSEAYGIFCGQIDQVSVQKILQNLATATNPNFNITHVHLLFQSSGGFVGDGVCLYNFFRSFQIPLTLYNVGAVLSIGTIAYLGAKERKASARALFQIHRSTIAPQNATATVLDGLAQALTIEDSRTKSILREHLKLGDEVWSKLAEGADISFSGEEAVKVGLADEIGEFSPPKGKQIFYI